MLCEPPNGIYFETGTFLNPCDNIDFVHGEHCRVCVCVQSFSHRPIRCDSRRSWQIARNNHRSDRVFLGG